MSPLVNKYWGISFLKIEKHIFFSARVKKCNFALPSTRCTYLTKLGGNLINYKFFFLSLDVFVDLHRLRTRTRVRVCPNLSPFFFFFNILLILFFVYVKHTNNSVIFYSRKGWFSSPSLFFKKTKRFQYLIIRIIYSVPYAPW